MKLLELIQEKLVLKQEKMLLVIKTGMNYIKNKITGKMTQMYIMVQKL